MKSILFCLSLFIFTKFCAQVPGDVAQNFGSYPGFDNDVNTLVTQTDGKILVGGAFNAFVGATENKIIRLNSDGSKDSSFNTGTGFNGNVRIISIQTDGKILVGGQFTSYNGESGNNRMIRLNPDGTKDSSFNTGIGFNGSVLTIAIQTDNKILVGGTFTDFNGVSENYIIRLNADGSKDITFNSGTGFNFLVRSIALQSDGKILIGGDFTSYNGASGNNRIIRLNSDGSKDTTFNTGTGFGSSVYTITTQTDGKILVGGALGSFNGVIGNIGLIRLNTNGSKDTTFNTGTGFVSNVNVITTQSDGKILLGGNFGLYNGLGGNNKIIRLNTNGIEDTTFKTGTGFDGIVVGITEQNDNKILVVGDFSTYNEITENRIIRFNVDGTKDNTFNSGIGFSNPVNVITTQIDNKILVGGLFHSYNGATGNNKIIRLNTNGTKDNSFNVGTGFNGSSVWSIVHQSDGKILVGGDFSTFNGASGNNRIIRLNSDGSKDTSFNSGTGFNGSVYNIAVQSDGKILVGGTFTNYNGVIENYIIRLNDDGSKDTSFNTGTGFNGLVNIIKIQSDGKILVGGNFSAYNGESENNRIIRLNADGTKDISFNTGTGFNGSVSTITTLTDDKILVGGDFTSYNGLIENRIICLSSDGTKDASFHTGTGFDNLVFKILTLTNGKIIVGGGFSTYKGNNLSAYLIGLNSELSLDSSNFDTTNTIVVYPNPVNDVLHCQSTNFTTIVGVKIYDLQGKLVKEATNEIVHVGNLSKGIYLVKIETEKGEFTKKFIKE